VKSNIQIGDLPSVSSEEAAYAAGFFDGEGYAAVESRKGPKGKMTYRGRITATQIDPTPLFWLQTRFGGSVRPHEIKPKQRPVWRWELSAVFMDRFFKIVHPYLIVKKAPVEVVMAYRAYLVTQPNPRSVGLTDQQIYERSLFNKKTRVANGRGAS
jgi:hypothetical protein